MNAAISVSELCGSHRLSSTAQHIMPMEHPLCGQDPHWMWVAKVKIYAAEMRDAWAHLALTYIVESAARSTQSNKRGWGVSPL